MNDNKVIKMSAAKKHVHQNEELLLAGEEMRAQHIQHLNDNPPSNEFMSFIEKISSPSEFKKLFDLIHQAETTDDESENGR